MGRLVELAFIVNLEAQLGLVRVVTERNGLAGQSGLDLVESVVPGNRAVLSDFAVGCEKEDILDPFVAWGLTQSVQRFAPLVPGSQVLFPGLFW